MSKTCANWDELEKEIMKRARKSLKTNVADKVRDKLMEHVQSDVYDTYNPVVYERRKNDGGLVDVDNIVATVKNDTLTVQEMAPLDPPKFAYSGTYGDGSLAQIIEAGAYNPWSRFGARDGAWTKPRPFVTNTQEDINNNPDEIIQILKDDIEK